MKGLMEFKKLYKYKMPLKNSPSTKLMMIALPTLTLKLLALSWITAKRQLIHDRTASRETWFQSYDFIIVGAGAAGCAIANRLTENPNVKVLLLEAGGAQSAIYNDIPMLVDSITPKRPDLQWLYYNVPQAVGYQYPERRIPEPRGKAIGGSSTHNGMYYNRGNRRIFDNWAKIYGAKGWSYEEVLPFFKKFENNTDSNIVSKNPGYHGTKGPVQISSLKNVPKALRLFQRAANEFGYDNTDINGPNQTGTMIMQEFISTNGFRASSANAYVDPNPHPNNLHIVAKALVTKILFKGLTAVGVEFAKNDKPYRVYAKKEVIISAGGINTAQVLMLSGVGIKSHLQKFGIPVVMDLPVGNNYINHPNVRLDSEILDPSLFWPIARLELSTLNDQYYRKGGILSFIPVNGLYYRSSDNIEWDFPNVVLFTVVANHTILDMTLNFVRVRSRGTVRLDSNSPYAPPRIDGSFLSDPNDLDEIVKALSKVFYMLEKSSIAPWVKPPSFDSIGCPVCPNKYKYECTEGLECFVRYWTFTTYHTCCSARMGDVDREDVVVDPRLRVKNLFKLRVCDSSIFPEVPNANTYAASLMVGEKCAQIIKDEYHLI